MALTIEELEALELDARDLSVDEIREQPLARFTLKSLSSEQVQALTEAIERNRPVYEALRDR